MVSLRYFKCLYHWARNTPNHLVRLETGYNHIEVEIVKRMFLWLNKVNNMPDYRLPRICMERLRALDKWPDNKVYYNWFTQLKEKLVVVGMREYMDINNRCAVKRVLGNLIEKFSNHHVSRDVEAAINSRYNSFYRNISTLGLGEQYLEIPNSLSKRRIISQLRKVLGCYAGKMAFVDDTRINWDKVRLAAKKHHENVKEVMDKSLKVLDECEKKSYEGLSHNEASYVVAKCIKDGYVQENIKWFF
uniref:Uncharacterized protein n=1 Tax=Rhodnius prolixus TaxID=13249 RepID=T1HMI0_RHOPR